LPQRETLTPEKGWGCGRKQLRAAIGTKERETEGKKKQEKKTSLLEMRKNSSSASAFKKQNKKRKWGKLSCESRGARAGGAGLRSGFGNKGGGTGKGEKKKGAPGGWKSTARKTSEQKTNGHLEEGPKRVQRGGVKW